MTKEHTPEEMLKGFIEAVKAGHRAIAWETIQESMSRGLAYEQLQLEFILPALQEIASGAAAAQAADLLRAQSTLDFIIERIDESAARQTSPTPAALIVGTAADSSHRRLEQTAALLLRDALSSKGWTASLAGPTQSSDEIAGRAAATKAEVLVLIGFSNDAPRRAQEIIESILVTDLNCRIILSGIGFSAFQAQGGGDKVVVLPDVRAAYLLLSAAGERVDETLEAAATEQPHEFLGKALEKSDVLFCTLSEDLNIISANRRCRDEFAMCQGENIRQYLETESLQIFNAMAKSEFLATETVELSLMRHGQPYLVDTLLIPCQRSIALLAQPRQEEIEKLTTILTNYNKEINALNLKLHKAEAAVLSQQNAIEAAHSELKRAYESLKSLEWRDPLTGAYNKHYYELALVKEVNRAKRYCRHLSFLMIDIDNFTDVNQEFGHPTGDAVLKHVAAFIQRNTRADIDWLARIGADEFVLVLPETDMKGCMAVGEKLRKEISAAPLPFADHLISITISAGGASFDPKQTIHLAYQELPRQADAALASARQKGSNTVFISRIG